MRSNKSLGQQRMDICMECPLLINTSAHGYICNKELWLNPLTNETSKKERSGYVRGCGCILKLATEISAHKCPAKKW